MGGNEMTKKVTAIKEYHHIVAIVRETSDGMKHICTSICYAPILKGTEIISDDNGELNVARCTDISNMFYHFSDGTMYAKDAMGLPVTTDASMIIIASEDSDKLPQTFIAKLDSLKPGTQILIETLEDGRTLRTRKDGTYIIHKYTTEAKLYDALGDIKEFLECSKPNIKDVVNYIEEILDKNEIAYY